MSCHSLILKRSKYRQTPNRGITLLEVLILIGIFVSVFVMLLPALLAMRESSRQEACVKNMKDLGIAFHNYASNHNNRFPASSGVTRGPDGKITAVDGWSWQVMVLPYLEHEQLYNSLDIEGGHPLAESSGSKAASKAEALATSLPELLCPSSHCSPFTGNGTKKMGITNYKAMGATHIESLSVASPWPLPPKYGQDAVSSKRSEADKIVQHPDGACFPGDGLAGGDFPKGWQWTFLLVESTEPHYARWAVGAESAVVGLPPNVEFEKVEYKQHAFDGYVPKGYRKALEKSPEAMSTYWTYHTYLDWDYDQQPYKSVGDQGAKYGPSSGHLKVVNHGLLDGGVWGMSRDIDISIYMSLITRNQVTPYGSRDDR